VCRRASLGSAASPLVAAINVCLITAQQQPQRTKLPALWLAQKSALPKAFRMVIASATLSPLKGGPCGSAPRRAVCRRASLGSAASPRVAVINRCLITARAQRRRLSTSEYRQSRVACSRSLFKKWRQVEDDKVKYGLMCERLIGSVLTVSKP